MDFKLGPIRPGKGLWAVKVNGEDRGDIELIELSHPNFGALTYGLHPDGYDTWAFRENGGGGAVTLPFVRVGHMGHLIGVIREIRKNMGPNPVLTAIGGFLNPFETHKDGQKRKTAEEAAINSERAFELRGIPLCSNRAFFVADASAHEGIHVFGLEVPSHVVGQSIGRNNPDVTFNEDYVLPGFKRTHEVVFLPPWQIITESPDIILVAAVARLTQHLGISH